VNNFVYLARSGWYDQATFYRVIPGSLVETGDPSGTGLGNPGYLFETEFATDLIFSQAGMVAYENDGLNTNGSRFFITLGPHPDLIGQNTIFGQVIAGMEVLSRLSDRDPQAGEILPPGDELISVTIEER
jgi:cyclophilin family peptidyl-prolyl cis-trans isomerase